MNLNTKYLRPEKAKSLQKWYEKFSYKEDLKSFEYENATILPLKKFSEDALLFGRGGVVDSNGDYVASSAIKDRVEGRYSFSNNDFYDKEVVYCGYLINHWGHFLIESVARLWYYLDNTDYEYVFFVQDSENFIMQSNIKEFFILLGIYDKIRIINKPTKFKKVIVPELAYVREYNYSQKYLEIFDRVVQNTNSKIEAEKINVFLTRSQFKGDKRGEIGNDMLDSLFSNNGYKIIAPEKTSLTQLIYYLNNTNCLVVPSGSAHHNVLFAPKKTKLVILERQVLNNEIQANINVMKDLDVTYIDANYVLTVSDVMVYYMAFNNNLKAFVADNKLNLPSRKFLTEKYKVKCLSNYYNALNQANYKNIHMCEWQFEYINYIYEAYKISANELYKYVNGHVIFQFKQVFDFKFKIAIKKLLKYLKIKLFNK